MFVIVAVRTVGRLRDDDGVSLSISARGPDAPRDVTARDVIAEVARGHRT